LANIKIFKHFKKKNHINEAKTKVKTKKIQIFCFLIEIVYIAVLKKVLRKRGIVLKKMFLE